MIINLTTNQIISRKEKYCLSLWQQGRGLMFSQKKNLVMVLPKEQKISLHNWFVFYPIDVLILNSNKKIIEIKRQFKPFNIWRSETKGKYVIELGFKNKYHVGDILSLVKS